MDLEISILLKCILVTGHFIVVTHDNHPITNRLWHTSTGTSTFLPFSISNVYHTSRIEPPQLDTDVDDSWQQRLKHRPNSRWTAFHSLPPERLSLISRLAPAAVAFRTSTKKVCGCSTPVVELRGWLVHSAMVIFMSMTTSAYSHCIPMMHPMATIKLPTCHLTLSMH